MTGDNISKAQIEEGTSLKSIKKKNTIFEQLKRNKLSMIGMIIIIIFIIAALFAPLIVTDSNDGTDTDIDNRLLSPSSEHWFGTDDLGRDVFSRVVLGSRISLTVGIIAIAVTMLIGISLGAISGYVGGRVDVCIMRFTDMCLALPSQLLAMAIAAALNPGLNSAMIAISLTWWPYYTRLVRGQALQLRSQPFVYAAKMMGAKHLHIIIKHILPNCIGPVIVNATLDMGYIILATASLGFIGIGAQPPTAEWGLMISTGRKFFFNAPWIAIFPGLAIFFTVLGFNLLGDGLRDIFDPQSRPR